MKILFLSKVVQLIPFLFTTTTNSPLLLIQCSLALLTHEEKAGWQLKSQCWDVYARLRLDDCSGQSGCESLGLTIISLIQTILNSKIDTVHGVLMRQIMTSKQYSLYKMIGF